MIKAVIFDLDDTLYPEIDYVKSGCNAIAYELAGKYVVKVQEYINTFNNLISQSPFGVIDRFCEVYSEKHFDKNLLLSIYRSHKPDIQLYDDVVPCLESLKKKEIKLALLTDGRPEGQRNKISALGIEKFFDMIVVTDEMGGIEYRKPNTFAYKLICDKFGVDFKDCLAVGDNLKKDFEIGDYGMKTIYLIRNNQIQAKEIQGIKKYSYIFDSLYQINKMEIK